MPAKKVPVALQLYSLRDVIPGDVPGTLKRVAEMGYDGVEFAGTYGLAGPEMRRLLEANRLRCAGAHTGLDLLEGEAFAQTAAFAQAVGNDRLIVPGADLQDLGRTIGRLNAAFARAKPLGLRVGYHNHVREFDPQDGRTLFERIFAETPPEFLVQLDIGWATAAGQDVPALLRRYAARIESVHVKEYDPDNGTAAVGEGAVRWPHLFDMLERETAVQWYVVEQEKYAVGPLESARTCIENIRKLGR